MTPVATGLLLVALAQAPAPQPTVAIVGESLCPTPGEVARRLEALAPEVSQPLRAVLTPRGEAVEVELRDAAGALVATRLLSADRCDVLADAAAIFLATWVRQLQPESFGVEAGLAEVSPSGSAAAPASTLAFEVGASAVAQVLNGAVGFGGGLDAALRPAGRPWGGSLALVVGPQAFLPLEPGWVAFRRSSARLGVSFRPSWGRLFLDVRAEAVASLLWMAGRGFVENASHLLFAPGAGASLRVGVALGPVRPFLGVLGTAWLIPETAAVEAAPATRPLPRAELLLAVGVAWGRP